MTSKNIPDERKANLLELLAEFPIMSISLNLPDKEILKRLILQNKEIECPHALNSEADMLSEYILKGLEEIGYLDSNMLSLKEMNLSILSALSRYINQVAMEYFFPEQCKLDPLVKSQMKEVFSRKIIINVGSALRKARDVK